jgi:hypothetical protein
VNKVRSVKIEAPVGARVLRILGALPGVSAARGPTGRLRVGSGSSPLRVEPKSRLDAAQAWRIVHREEASVASPLLVVAQHSTREARRILTDHGIGVADGQGNAHLELPGVLIHVEATGDRGRRPQPAGQPRLGGKAGLAVQVLLLHPARGWGVNDLAKESGISAGLAHRVLARLEAERVVVSQGRGPKKVREVADPRALLDLWAEEAEDRAIVRTPAYVLARTPRELLERVSGALDGEGIPHAATGAAAASLLAPFVTAVPVSELWLSSSVPPDEALAAAGGEVVEGGDNMAILQAADDTPLAFARRVDGVWVANPFRIYRDLLRDPRRGREQAQRFREEVIRF